jgi:hypothetical protein
LCCVSLDNKRRTTSALQNLNTLQQSLILGQRLRKALSVSGNIMKPFNLIVAIQFLAILGCKIKSEENAPYYQNDSIPIREVKLKEFKRPPTKDDLKFIHFWTPIANAISRSDFSKLKIVALDSLQICDSVLKPNAFFKRCYWEIFDNKLISVLYDTLKIEYTWTEIDPTYILPCARSKVVKVEGIYRVRQVVITKEVSKVNPLEVFIDFIETKDGYKFYSCGYYGNRKCCR